MVNMLPSRFPTVMRTLLVVPLIAVALTACGAAQEAVSEQIVEEAAGEGVDLEIGDDGQIASIETEDGSLEMSANGEVPEEWPDDVPLFEDGTVNSSQVATSDGQTIVSIDFVTDADAGAVFEAMVDAYESAGFTTTATTNMGDDSGSIDGYVGERNGTTITMSVISDPSSPTGVILGVVFPAA